MQGAVLTRPPLRRSEELTPEARECSVRLQKGTVRGLCFVR
jgi:hypothetical protein